MTTDPHQLAASSPAPDKEYACANCGKRFMQTDKYPFTFCDHCMETTYPTPPSLSALLARCERAEYRGDAAEADNQAQAPRISVLEVQLETEVREHHKAQEQVRVLREAIDKYLSWPDESTRPLDDALAATAPKGEKPCQA